MSTDGPAARRSRPVDAVALARTRARLEAAQRPPWLHEEAARRMALRLQLIRRAPRHVIDWWPNAGGSEPALDEALRGARIDRPGQPRGGAAGPWWLRWRSATAPQVGAAAAAQVDLVWANMLLHHVADPLELMGQWQRSLAVGGLLMFSTLGPGSLLALRRLYRAAGWGEPMAEPVDMHDIGDMLVEAGFADPVMDQELVRLSWSSAEDALAELRTLGANAAPTRYQGLRTPRWRRQWLEQVALAATQSPSERIELQFELVYGHAVRPEPRARVAPETRIGLDELRHALRRPPAAGTG